MKIIKDSLKPIDYKSKTSPTWCKGCGDFGVLNGYARAMSELHLDPKNVVTISGIGCSGRLPLWLKTYGFHSCHGRGIPTAVGMKIARPDLTIVVTAGDGDLFSIGAGHIPHAVRRNFDITVLCMDNHIYALTKNQVSPTSRLGKKGSFNPYGNLDNPINPIELMIIYGATFVAQSYAGNIKHTTSIIKKAIMHKGFSFVNLLSPCPTFNHEENFKYYKNKVKNINEDDSHNTNNLDLALELSKKCIEHLYNSSYKEVPIGIFYKKDKAVFNDHLNNLHKKYNRNINWDNILDNYKV